jgi:hypothetical protein
VPKRNFGFEKRQKELAKKEKKQHKLQRRLDRATRQGQEMTEELPSPPAGEPQE